MWRGICFLGACHECRPGGEHSHAGKADPPAEILRVRRTAEPGRRTGAGLRFGTGLPLDANAAAEPLAPTLARHADADEHAIRSRADLRQWAGTEFARRRARPIRAHGQSLSERIDLLQPTNVPADIAATLLYPVTDRPFRELYEMTCGWNDRRRAEVIDVALGLANFPRPDSRWLPRRPVRL